MFFCCCFSARRRIRLARALAYYATTFVSYAQHYPFRLHVVVVQLLLLLLVWLQSFLAYDATTFLSYAALSISTSCRRRSTSALAFSLAASFLAYDATTFVSYAQHYPFRLHVVVVQLLLLLLVWLQSFLAYDIYICILCAALSISTSCRRRSTSALAFSLAAVSLVYDATTFVSYAQHYPFRLHVVVVQLLLLLLVWLQSFAYDATTFVSYEQRHSIFSGAPFRLLACILR